MTTAAGQLSQPIDFIEAYESYARDLSVLGEDLPDRTSPYEDLGGLASPTISEAPLARFGYFVDVYLNDERKTDLRRGLGDLALGVITIASLAKPSMDATTRHDYSAALTDYSNLLMHRSRQLRTPGAEGSQRLVDIYGADIDGNWAMTYGGELTLLRNRLPSSALFARASMIDSGVSKAALDRRRDKNITGRWQLQQTEAGTFVVVKERPAVVGKTA